MSKPRWKRIESISEEEFSKLLLLTDKTKGITLYGHRARASVMLPLSLATQIADIAKQEALSIGQVIVNLLETQCQQKSDLL